MFHRFSVDSSLCHSSIVPQTVYCLAIRSFFSTFSGPCPGLCVCFTAPWAFSSPSWSRSVCTSWDLLPSLSRVLGVSWGLCVYLWPHCALSACRLSSPPCPALDCPGLCVHAWRCCLGLVQTFVDIDRQRCSVSASNLVSPCSRNQTFPASINMMQGTDSK